MAEVQIDSIIVGERHRRDLGDIEALAASIEEVGLLHPVVVTPDLRLIAGQRRIEAYKHLGRESIPVYVVDLDDVLRGECDENRLRKDFAPSEWVDIGRVLEDRIYRNPVSCRNNKIDTRDIVASYIGVSGKTYEKAKTIVEAAEQEPDEFSDLVTEMDKTGKVDRVHRKYRERKVRMGRETNPPSHFKRDGIDIYHCTALELIQKIQPESVDLIFTDPPYDEKSLPRYSELASLAAYALKPGALCLAYSGQTFAPQVIERMSEHLTFAWICAIQHTGGNLRFRKFNIRNNWKPVFAFYKPPLAVWWEYFDDLVSGGREKTDHKWQQAVMEAKHYIQALCPKGGIVLDPFLGSGTTAIAARELDLWFVGCDKDKQAIATAIGRLENGD